MVTPVYFPIAFLKQFHHILKPFTHSIELENHTFTASPLIDYLSRQRTSEEYYGLIALDYAARQNPPDFPIEYNDAMLYIDFMLLMADYTIEHYDELIPFYADLKPKDEFCTAYTGLLRARLDKRVGALHQLLPSLDMSNPLSKTHLALKENIIRIYHKIDLDFEEVERMVSSPRHHFKEADNLRWLFDFYCVLLEINLAKPLASPNIEKSEMSPLAIEPIFSRMTATEQLLKNTFCHLVLLQLKSRVEFRIHHNINASLATIRSAFVYLRKHTDTDSIAYRDFTNSLSVRYIECREYYIRINNLTTNFSQINQTLEAFILMEPTINSASNGEKRQLHRSMEMLSNYLKDAIDDKLPRAKRCHLDELETSANLGLAAIALLAKIVTLRDSVQSNADSYKAQLKTITTKREKLAKEPASKTKQLAVPLPQNSDLDKQVAKLLKQFPMKVAKKNPQKKEQAPPNSLTKEKKNVELDTSQTQEANQIIKENTKVEVEALQHKEGESTILSISDACKQFIATKGVDCGEGFIDSQTPQNRAEAMLYIGDYLVRRDRLYEALEMFKRAMSEAENRNSGSIKIKEGILFMLEGVSIKQNELLKAAIRKKEEAEYMRNADIRMMGLEICQKSGIDADEKTLAELGKKEMIRRGKERKDDGLPLSKKAKKHQLINEKFEVLKDKVEKIDTVIEMATIRKQAIPKPENLPLLKGNTALMYQPAPTLKEVNPSARQAMAKTN